MFTKETHERIRKYSEDLGVALYRSSSVLLNNSVEPAHLENRMLGTTVPTAVARRERSLITANLLGGMLNRGEMVEEVVRGAQACAHGTPHSGWAPWATETRDSYIVEDLEIKKYVENLVRKLSIQCLRGVHEVIVDAIRSKRTVAGTGSVADNIGTFVEHPIIPCIVPLLKHRTHVVGMIHCVHKTADMVYEENTGKIRMELPALGALPTTTDYSEIIHRTFEPVVVSKDFSFYGFSLVELLFTLLFSKFPRIFSLNNTIENALAIYIEATKHFVSSSFYNTMCTNPYLVYIHPNTGFGRRYIRIAEYTQMPRPRHSPTLYKKRKYATGKGMACLTNKDFFNYEGFLGKEVYDDTPKEEVGMLEGINASLPYTVSSEHAPCASVPTEGDEAYGRLARYMTSLGIRGTVLERPEEQPSYQDEEYNDEEYEEEDGYAPEYIAEDIHTAYNQGVIIHP